jgi:cholesterol oxidase
MLGAVTDHVTARSSRSCARRLTTSQSATPSKNTPVGVFFGPPGERAPDPYSGGAGPGRTDCTQCGNCMVGCRIGAKNTLVKNYLDLAERFGATIEQLRTVVALEPIDDASRNAGYRVTRGAPAEQGVPLVT